MTTSRRRSTRGGRPQRRTPTRTTWDQIFQPTSMAAAAAITIIELTSPQISSSLGQTGTILRWMGRLMIQSNDVAQLIEMAWGVAVVTADALVAGAVPDPLTDEAQAWYYWDAYEGTIAIIGEGPRGGLEIKFDIRSKRRLRSGYRLAFIIEKEASPSPVEVFLASRAVWSVP